MTRKLWQNSGMDEHPFPATTLSLRVYYEDTDAGGVVYYANYAKYLERGRTEWLRALGLEHAQLAAQTQRVFVVTRLALQYRKPARLDDVLTVHTRMARLRRASLEFAQSVWRGEQLLCDATVQVACVDARTLRPAALPARIVEHLP